MNYRHPNYRAMTKRAARGLDLLASDRRPQGEEEYLLFQIARNALACIPQDVVAVDLEKQCADRVIAIGMEIGHSARERLQDLLDPAEVHLCKDSRPESEATWDAFQNLMPDTPEGRLLEFCFGDEAVAEMTDEEVDAELKAEGIDLTDAQARLRTVLAAHRLARGLAQPHSPEPEGR